MVNPTTATIAVGGTQQFTATARDQFDQPMTASDAWAVSAGGGTISSSGLYTGPSTTGTATVQATAGSLSATAAVTIVSAQGPAAPTNLAASITQKNKAKLTWLDNASNEGGFRVWSSRDGLT